MSNLILGKDVLTDWKIYPLDIDGAIAGGWPHSDSQKFFPTPHKEPSVGPVFYMGTLQPNGVVWDTFLKLNEWTKVMLISDFGTNTLPSLFACTKNNCILMIVFLISGSGLD